MRSVTEFEVSQTKRSLKPSKTKDVFGIDTFMLKELSHTLAAPVTEILNHSVSQAIFPNVWKSAVVIPIYKVERP